MNPSGIEMADAILKEGGGVLLFGLCLVAVELVVLVALLFGALAVRGLWRWITRGSWNSVVVSLHRKALR